ncbi:MAG: hypothetical protein KJ949_02690 [Nanoarchaeota archaeon]|nr:hypothetical protein [Nanoarchaeota archaeon]MBU4308634.1 hypothetical protein [Nanoarchaeota archaeon]
MGKGLNFLVAGFLFFSSCAIHQMPSLKYSSDSCRQGRKYVAVCQIPNSSFYTEAIAFREYDAIKRAEKKANILSKNFTDSDFNRVSLDNVIDDKEIVRLVKGD